MSHCFSALPRSSLVQRFGVTCCFPQHPPKNFMCGLNQGYRIEGGCPHFHGLTRPLSRQWRGVSLKNVHFRGSAYRENEEYNNSNTTNNRVAPRAGGCQPLFKETPEVTGPPYRGLVFRATQRWSTKAKTDVAAVVFADGKLFCSCSRFSRRPNPISTLQVIPGRTLTHVFESQTSMTLSRYMNTVCVLVHHSNILIVQDRVVCQLTVTPATKLRNVSHTNCK